MAPSSAWLIETMYMAANGVPLDGEKASPNIIGTHFHPYEQCRLKLSLTHHTDTDGNGIQHDLPTTTLAPPAR